MELTESLEQHQFCHLTANGRSTGRPHRIEIWFVIIDGRLFVMSGRGGRSDWVKNLIANPSADIEIGDNTWKAIATIHAPATDHAARRRLAERYEGWRPGELLSSWATHGVVIEFRVPNGS